MHIGVNSQRIAFSALVRMRALLVACASFCFVGIGVFFALAGGALATEATKPAQIDRNGVLIMVRTTLLAVDAANKTGNYTVLRDLAAPGFGSANNAAKLGDIFASNRRDGLDLSGVAVLDPQLTRLPEIDENGMMRMAGFFPSVPKQVNFDLVYQPVGGQWRLFGIGLNIGPSGPVPHVASPSPSSPSPPEAKTVAKSPPKGISRKVVSKPEAHSPATTSVAEPAAAPQ